MSFLQKYGEPFGLDSLSLLAFYGTLTVIVLGALVLGVIVQMWKHRSGGLWAVASLVLSTGGWIYALKTVDQAVYAVTWGGDQSWGALAIGVTGVVLTALLLAVAVLPSAKPGAKRPANLSSPSEFTSSLSAQPFTPVLPLRASHSFRRKLFAPMVVLGIIAFIAMGIMSVEKKQLDTLLRALGIIAAEAPVEVKFKLGTSSKTKSKAAAKAPVADPLIIEAQRLLLELGYDAGKADGAKGKSTEEAVRAYQGWEGLPRNGDVTSELVTHMKKVKKIRETYRKETPLISDYQLHANMCVRGTRAWYRSRTTKLSIDSLSYSKNKYSIETRVWFSYPGEELERVRAYTACLYSRYREEMPEAPFSVNIKTGQREESLSDSELKCFSQGQPC